MADDVFSIQPREEFDINPGQDDPRARAFRKFLQENQGAGVVLDPQDVMAARRQGYIPPEEYVPDQEYVPPRAEVPRMPSVAPAGPGGGPGAGNYNPLQGEDESGLRILRKPYDGPKRSPDEMLKLYEELDKKSLSPEEHRERQLREMPMDEVMADLGDPDAGKVFGEDRIKGLREGMREQRRAQMEPEARDLLDRGRDPVYAPGEFVPSDQRKMYDYVERNLRMPQTDKDYESVFGLEDPTTMHAIPSNDQKTDEFDLQNTYKQMDKDIMEDPKTRIWTGDPDVDRDVLMSERSRMDAYGPDGKDQWGDIQGLLQSFVDRHGKGALPNDLADEYSGFEVEPHYREGTFKRGALPRTPTMPPGRRFQYLEE